MKRGALAAAVLAPALLLGGVVTVATVAGGGADPRPTASPSVSPTPSPSPTADPVVERYAGEIRPIMEEGGKVVELGIKPALADYASGVETLGELAQESRAWISALGGLRRRLAAVDAPPVLARAHATYLRALDQYLAVARRLQRASRDPDAKRAAVVREVTRLGNAADKTYDAAERLLDEHR